MRTAQPFDQLLGIHCPDNQRAPMSKTAAMRAYLKRRGRATAAQLAEDAQLANTGLVGALLKADLDKGVVVREGSWYVWDEGHDEAQRVAIQAAIRLLTAAGYRVETHTNRGAT